MIETRARWSLNLEVERLPLHAPFRISGHVFVDVPILRATLRDGTRQGRGEAAGVYYFADQPDGMDVQLREVAAELEAGISRQALRALLPPGGARNAIDCALWELESHKAGVPVWGLAGIPEPTPRITTFTLSAEAPEVMAASAHAVPHARALKLKLTGEPGTDSARVEAVRAARPDVWLGVDANQGFTPATLEGLLSTLVDCRVSLLEQPFARGREADHDGLRLPLPVAADESCQDLQELEALPGRFDVVNIKLDKCGGLTEGLLMAHRARALGLDVMVGNMVGTSLAMAPAFVLGQLCDIVDLDGPTILATDVSPGVSYEGGEIWCPAEVWGGG